MSGSAFVLMPFEEPFLGYYDKIYKVALERIGFDVKKVDDIFSPSPIIEDIQTSILKADLILCEMSGRNPNVFYELGIAHSVGKPAILLSKREDDNPFDVRHIRTIIYNTEEAGWEDKLRESIRLSAKAVLESKEVWPKPLMTEDNNLHKKTHNVTQDRLEDIMEQILLLLSNSGDSNPTSSQIANELGMNKTKTEYYLNRLIEKDYVYDLLFMGSPAEYCLNDDGKAYLVENDLI